jgi:hypothetical protein
VILRRRLVMNVPFFAARLIGGSFDLLQAMTGGLIANKLLTRDQVAGLSVDNLVSPGAKGLADLGIVPTPTAAVLPDYLWRFRPTGQYDAIKASAKNLRKHP